MKPSMRRKNLLPSPLPAALALSLLATPTAWAAPLSLSKAVELAVAHDPAVPASLATYAADREAGVQERTRLKPVITAQGTAYSAYTDSKVGFGSARDSYPGYTAEVSARQPLYRADWGSYAARATAQNALAASAQQDRTQQFFVRVADRYFAVLLAQDEIGQLLAQQQAIATELSEAKKRYSVGEIAGVDVKEAQARFDLAQAQVLLARSALESTRESLAESTGSLPEALAQLPETVNFAALSPAELAPWLALAREKNPALASLRSQLELAQQAIASRRADRLPSVDVVGSLSRSDSHNYQRLGSSQSDARVGLQLTVPIYAAGYAESRIREAQARAEASAASLALQVSTLERSVRERHRNALTAYAQTSAYGQALRSAEAAETATRAGYEAGTRTITDVLNAKSSTVQAHRALSQARYALLSAQLQLKQSAGVLAPADFVAIDQLLTASTTVTAVPAP